MFMETFIRTPSSEQNLLLRLFLTPLSLTFGFVIFLRNFFYDRGIFRINRLPGIVISIGNLTVGGTGKSPFVIQLADYLKRHGATPVILTRGYKSLLKKTDSVALLDGVEVMPSQSGAVAKADEALMQSKKQPDVYVVVGVDRLAAAQRFIESLKVVPTHWLLDDGFQHRKLFRDLNIALCDAASPMGNERLLPIGPLREPPSGLSRADIVVFTRASTEEPSAKDLQSVENLGNFLSFKAPCVNGELTLVAGESPDREPTAAVCAVGAIANSANFLTSLHKVGVQIKSQLLKQDHSRFNLRELAEKSRDCVAIVTTEKDYWRDREVFHRLQKPVYVLPMSFKLAESDFAAMLAKLPNSLP